MLFEIGEEIRKERKRRKISQEKIAKDLGEPHHDQSDRVGNRSGNRRPQADQDIGLP